MGNQQWPFKHLKQDSSWPLQGLACSLAVVVYEVPAELAGEVRKKVAERVYRLAARVCLELEVPPAIALHMAETQLVREIPGAKENIAAFREGKAEAVEAEAGKLLNQMLGGGQKPGEA